MTIYLHVGTHKTGTTAIQRFAAKHRAALKQRGLWYPSYGEIGAPEHYAHHHLAHAVAGQANWLSMADAERFCKHVRTQRRDADVLLSAEPMYRHLIRLGNASDAGTSVARADYWSSRKAYIGRLRAFFPDDDVVVLLCFREQGAFARSLYQEKIKISRYHADFANYVARHLELFDYLQNGAAFHEFFPTIRVETYERLAANGNLIDNFFAWLGVSVTGLRKPEVVNASLPARLVEFKRILNRSRISDARLSELTQALMLLAKKPSGAYVGDIVDSHCLATLWEASVVPNDVLRKRFAPHIPAPIFPPPPKAPPAHSIPVSLNADDVAAIFAELL
jgi:hypothetical protein